MPATQPRLNPDDLERLADEIFDRRIRPTLTPDDDEKFVAIDVDTGEYEIDGDDHAAIERLHGRLPVVNGWLRRGGHKEAYDFRRFA